MKKIGSIAAALLLTILTSLASTTSAHAAGGNKHCPAGGSYGNWCDLHLSSHFPGGKIWIDVDVTGTSNAQGTWHLYINHREVCYADFRYSDGPRTWTCNVGAGKPSLSVPKPSWESANIAVRW